MSRARWGALSVLSVVACGDILGLDQYTDSDGSVADVTSPTDAAPEVSLRSCEDGNVCIPVLPSGWAWAMYDQDAQPPCPTSYLTPTDLMEGIDAGEPTCGCGCTVATKPSCLGTLTINAGTNAGCNNVISAQSDVADGGCDLLSKSITMTGGDLSVTGPAASGGTCTPAPTDMVPPVGFATTGRTCVPSTAGTDAGCASGAVCMPDPTPFGACISQAGDMPCPGAFVNKHLVGTMTSDTRTCSACTCEMEAGTCAGTATFYTTACSKGAQTINVNGTCQAVSGSGSHTFTGYEYAPAVDASCIPSTSVADGSVTFSDLTTVCCY